MDGLTVTYEIGRHVYVYSNQTGRWDVLTLKTETAAPVQFNGRKAYYEDNVLHVFNIDEGRWQDLDLK